MTCAYVAAGRERGGHAQEADLRRDPEQDVHGGEGDRHGESQNRRQKARSSGHQKESSGQKAVTIFPAGKIERQADKLAAFFC